MLWVLIRNISVKTRNLPNGYVVTAGGVQEMELNTQSKHCSAMRAKKVKVGNRLWKWAGCIMANECMKFHLPRSLDV